MKLSEEVRRIVDSAQEPLRPAAHVSLMAERARLVESMRNARQEIAQIFIDCEHWNTHVRKSGEHPIDPDPDGDLRALAAFYDRVLKNDVQ